MRKLQAREPARGIQVTPLKRTDFPTDDAYLAAMLARYRRQYRLPL